LGNQAGTSLRGFSAQRTVVASFVSCIHQCISPANFIFADGDYIDDKENCGGVPVVSRAVMLLEQMGCCYSSDTEETPTAAAFGAVSESQQSRTQCLISILLQGCDSPSSVGGHSSSASVLQEDSSSEADIGAVVHFLLCMCSNSNRTNRNAVGMERAMVVVRMLLLRVTAATTTSQQTDFPRTSSADTQAGFINRLLSVQTDVLNLQFILKLLEVYFAPDDVSSVVSQVSSNGNDDSETQRAVSDSGAFQLYGKCSANLTRFGRQYRALFPVIAITVRSWLMQWAVATNR
jgi:hypothetical protein